MTFHNPCPALWDFSSLQAPIVTAWSDRQHVGTFTEETSLENRKKFVAAIRSFARALWKRYHLECEGISTEYWVQQNLLGFRCDLGELICQRLGWDYRLIDLIEEPLITTCAHHYTQVEDPTSCWGLARISNKEWGPNQMPTSFNYDPMGGDGVTVIVIDSGVKENHPEFGGRVLPTVSFSGDRADNLGHGTHIAGIIAGSCHGVARKVTILPIKVIDLESQYSHNPLCNALRKAYTYVETNPGAKFIVNLSLTAGRPSSMINFLIRKLVEQGAAVFVAAGNSAKNVDEQSPSSASHAFVVGNCTQENAMNLSSGFGKGVSAFAPGTDIQSTGLEDNRPVVMTGTSQSCAYASGVAAAIAARENFLNDGRVAALYLRLRDLALKDILSGIRGTGTPNELIYNGHA